MYVTVETESGALRGQEKSSDYFSHKKYFSFQGIPYAKPPLGPLRFRDPEEPEPWSGVRDALKEGDDCLQIHIMQRVPVGSEDCLYLNVYTPQLDSDEGLAVMVWIHGGGFMGGSGSTELHGPDYLIEQDIVLVTINYRLGTLGFLCLDHEEVPGNAGLKDQVMALRWLQKNIASFGGNPRKVTIFGESAGGAAVHYLLLSPLSQGLFQNAIIQSGSALNQWAHVDRTTLIDRAFRMGKALGCDTRDTEELLQFLRNIPVNDFMTVNNSVLTEDELLNGFAMIFLPCVEEPATSCSFLPVSSKELLKQGKFAKVPTIMGSMSAEGAIGAAFLNISEENIGNVYEKCEKYIVQDVGSEKAKVVSKELKDFYFGEAPVTMKNIDMFLELYGDAFFDYGIDEGLRIMVETKEAAPVYSYEFTHSLSSSFLKVVVTALKPDVNFKGVCHGEDISFLFNHRLEGVKKLEAEDEHFIAKITKMWATFAKTGNPNYSGMEAEWEPVKNNQFCHLDIGSELKLVPERVKQQRMNLWQQLYDENSQLQ